MKWLRRGRGERGAAIEVGDLHDSFSASALSAVSAFINKSARPVMATAIESQS